MSVKEAVVNFYKYGPTKSKVVVTLGLIGILLIIVISIVGILMVAGVFEDDTHINVVNESEIEEVPKDYKNSMLKTIWAAIESSNDITGVEFEDAVVREGSYNSSAEDGLTVANFILDIEALHYSFDVTATWREGVDSGKDPDIQVRCPYYLDVIYTDTKCIAQSPIEQLERYLPHYEYLRDDLMYSVELHKYDSFQEHAGEQYLAVRVKACKNAELLDRAVEETKKWIKSVYLDPNDYYWEPIDSCYAL